MNYWRTAITAKPTFHELAAFIISVLILGLIAILLVQRTPVPDFLVGAFGAITGFTFGTRIGRTDEIINEQKEKAK